MDVRDLLRWSFHQDYGTTPERYLSDKKEALRNKFGLCSSSEIEHSFLLGNLNLEEMKLKFKDNIIRISKNNNIDARAIIGAISWEYEENLKGRWSDKLQRFWTSADNEIGLGWGSVHTQIATEIYPDATNYELNCLRLNAPTAIRLVGKIMGKFAQCYYEQSDGIWINDNPVLLAYFYNTGMPKILASAKKRRLRQSLPNHQIYIKVLVNPMAKWLKTHLTQFNEFKTRPKPPTAFLPVVKAV